MPTPGENQKRELKGLLCALLLAADGPLSMSILLDLINGAVDEEEWPTPVHDNQLQGALQELAQDYDGEMGIELVEVADGWRFRTAPRLGNMVRRLWPERKLRLSKAALEALAVIAYKQPCTRHEIENVRGVDCGGVVRSLLEKGLIRITGKSDDVGRPLLYGTTALFLETFSMKNISALPTLRSLDELDSDQAAQLQFQVTETLADRFKNAMPVSAEAVSGQSKVDSEK
ncbi:MAG: SMC-Scp complex subunit ScpB [Myxococcota bacterium]|nr:SMC-Scp complex subunit ScpB [Myxococcota bacterium]